MQLAISLFPDIDGLDGLIEATMPMFVLWMFAVAVVLAGAIGIQAVDRFLTRSPVEKLLRRHARRSLGEGGRVE